MTKDLKSLLDEEGDNLAKLRQIKIRQPRNTIVTPEVGEVDRILRELHNIYDRIEKIDPEYVSLRRAKPLQLGEVQIML